MKEVRFGDRVIGEGRPAFVIAEAGVNHNGDIELGRALIREAKLAGADAIKFQSYKAGKLATKTAPRYWFEPDDPHGSQYDSFARLDRAGSDGYQEVYVCPKGFDGTYRVLLRRVWGEVTGGKVHVEVINHHQSNNPVREARNVDLKNNKAVVHFDLKNGRREQPLAEHQIANAALT